MSSGFWRIHTDRHCRTPCLHGLDRFSILAGHREDADMSRSNRLTLRDMRRVHELLEQAAELGAEPDAWRQFLMDQARQLLRARVAITMDCAGAAVGAIPR